MLDEPEEDGSPLLDHLLSIERQTGVRPQILLDAPPLPATCEELWRIFNELHSCRGSNGFGANRITYADIDAFQRVSGVKLSAWERDTIRLADAAYMRRQADRKPNS